MKDKKICAAAPLVLAAVMSCTMLAGCGNASGSSAVVSVSGEAADAAPVRSTAGSGAYAAGMQDLADSDYKDAIDQFQKAIDEEGRKAEGLRGQGIAYLYLGQYDKALDAFSGALNSLQYPDQNQDFQEDVLFYQAQAYTADGQTDKAIPIYDKLLKGDHAATAYLLRGKIYAGQNKFGQAGQDFQHAIALNDSYEVYLQIYDVYVQNNRQADGANFLKQAQDKDPQTPEDNYQLGRISYELKDYDKAEDYLKTAVNGKVSGAIALLGRVYLDAGDISGARSLYQKCIDDGSATAIGYNGLAICDMEDGNYDKALQDISSGLASGDTSMKEELLYNEIICYEKKLDFQTAADKMKTFLSSFPQNAQAVRENTFIQGRVTEQNDGSAQKVSGSGDSSEESGEESVTSDSTDSSGDTSGADTSADTADTYGGTSDAGTSDTDAGYADGTYQDSGYSDDGYSDSGYSDGTDQSADYDASGDTYGSYYDESGNTDDGAGYDDGSAYGGY